MKKTKPIGTLKVRMWPFVTSLIENGLELGWNRAHKHTDTPDKHLLLEKQYDAVTEMFSDAFDFGDYE